MFKTELFNEISSCTTEAYTSRLASLVVSGKKLSDTARDQLQYLIDTMALDSFKLCNSKQRMKASIPGISDSSISINTGTIWNGRVKGTYDNKRVTFDYETCDNLISLFLSGECIGVFCLKSFL